MRLRVGVAVGRGVGVLDPVKPAVVGDDDVGVGVEREERRKRVDALLDQPAEEDAALAGERAGDQDVGVGERPGEGESAEEAAQLDAALAGVARRRLAFVGLPRRGQLVAAQRVVELLGAGVGDHVGVGGLAVVDARLDDLEVERAAGGLLDHLRRNVGNPELRLARTGHLIDRRHHHAEAVRELEPPVDPRIAGSAGGWPARVRARRGRPGARYRP